MIIFSDSNRTWRDVVEALLSVRWQVCLLIRKQIANHLLRGCISLRYEQPPIVLDVKFDDHLSINANRGLASGNNLRTASLLLRPNPIRFSATQTCLARTFCPAKKDYGAVEALLIDFSASRDLAPRPRAPDHQDTHCEVRATPVRFGSARGATIGKELQPKR
jgi:hypothetical protein